MLWAIKKGLFRIFHRIMKVAICILTPSVPVLLTGPGSIRQLAENLSAKGIEHVLIVTDKILVELNIMAPLLASLTSQNIRYTIFDDVEPNPTVENVENGKALYEQMQCNALIAFGGGSPIDCAKIIGARVRNPYMPLHWMKGLFRVFLPIPPFFCVPTTAGTGSEATVGGVIKDPVRQQKFVISDLKLVPKIAVLDPELMCGLPGHITATTGMDALTHAVEAYIGINGSPFSDKASEKVVRLIFENLETAYTDPTNITARHHMALAAFYAGAAVTRTNLGYVHAIAHKLGGLYGVPHGLANAIILPSILEFSKKEAKEKLAALAVAGGIGTADESPDVLSTRFIAKVKEMNRRMQIPATIQELRPRDIEAIVKDALSEAHPMYPVPRFMTPEECTTLVTKLLPA